MPYMLSSAYSKLVLVGLGALALALLSLPLNCLNAANVLDGNTVMCPPVSTF
jgi:hypothetical protein